MDYAVNVDGQSFEIVFRDFLQYKEKVDAPIVITYSATLNEKAKLTPDENTNTAYLEFSNDPNTDYEGGDPTDGDDDKPAPGEATGKTPGKTVVTYTTALRLQKVDEDGAKLTGAKFKISGTAAKAVIINQEIYQESKSGTYYRLKNGTYTETAPVTEGDGANADQYDSTTVLYEKVTVVTKDTNLDYISRESWVDSNGYISYSGLGAGTYTITELEAPVGFNKLTDDITVTIGFEYTDNKPVWTVTAKMGEESFFMEEEVESLISSSREQNASVNRLRRAISCSGTAGGSIQRASIFRIRSSAAAISLRFCKICASSPHINIM